MDGVNPSAPFVSAPCSVSHMALTLSLTVASLLSLAPDDAKRPALYERGPNRFGA